MFSKPCPATVRSGNLIFVKRNLRFLCNACFQEQGLEEKNKIMEDVIKNIEVGSIAEEVIGCGSVRAAMMSKA